MDPVLRTARFGAALLVPLALVACGGSSNNSSTKNSPTSHGSSSSGTSGTSGTSASSTTAGVDPNATEANPAGDIPDNQVFVPYTFPSAAFSVKVPEGWARTTANGVVSFTDKLNTISLEQVPAAAMPTIGSVRARDLPVIARTAKHYTVRRVTVARRNGGTAVLVEYRADSKPDPVTGKIVSEAIQRFAFWRNGKEAIVSLSGPVTADNVDPWRLVSDSFTWK